MTLLKEIVASKAQCKGGAEICQEASQEQGQLSAGCVRLLSPSASRGEEEGGQPAPVEELIFQLYIHWGLGQILEGPWEGSGSAP